MVDVFDAAKRSEVMSRIRGRGNKSTELKLAAAFRHDGVTGWRRHLRLRPRLAEEDQVPGSPRLRISVSPDFAFRSHKVAVFVDGCFWHGCPIHSTKPKANADFWAKKLAGNIQRDGRAARALEAVGWTVVRVWEHELVTPESVVKRVVSSLCGHGVR